MDPLVAVYTTVTKLKEDTMSSGTCPPQYLPSGMEITPRFSTTCTAAFEQFVLFTRSKKLK